MPYKPKKMCKHPGCPDLTHEAYCGEHIKEHTRPSAHERGYTSKWRKLSKAYLMTHPLCVQCNKNGKVTPATVVDHIIPHRGDEHLMWSQSNWDSLCKRCHDIKTRKYDNIPTYKY